MKPFLVFNEFDLFIGAKQGGLKPFEPRNNPFLGWEPSLGDRELSRSHWFRLSLPWLLDVPS